MGDVVVCGVIALEHAREAAVELERIVIGFGAPGALGVVPALGPQQQHAQEMALQVGSALVERAGALGAQARDRRVEGRDLVLWYVHDAAAGTEEEPAGVRSRWREAVQQLVGEADGRAGDVVGALEDVNLAAPDERDRPGLDGDPAPVELGVALAGAGPDQLVVVVPVRLAGGLVAANLEAVDQDDLDRLGGVREAVDAQATVVALEVGRIGA